MPRRVHPNERREDRDPNKLNQHLKSAFSDVIGERRALRSVEIVWVCSQECYTFFHSCCYGFVSFLLAPFLAIGWGCTFAFTAFKHIWCLTPIFKNCYICCESFFGRCMRSILNCCVTPWTNSCGGIFVAFHKDIPEAVVVHPKPRQTKVSSRDKKNEDQEPAKDPEPEKKVLLAAPVVMRDSSFFSGNKIQANKSIQRQLGLYQ
ncbi:caveolin-2-like [Saccostrea cucullata]|uniref:caveolin-2-like n=1 Tax=Saccostrea cuccullata TaxID=36930 RepID=UPI002ED219B0